MAVLRVIEDHLNAAGIDNSAKEHLQDLARIHRAPLYRAGITVTKTSTPSEQHQRLFMPSAPACRSGTPLRCTTLTREAHHGRTSQ